MKAMLALSAGLLWSTVAAYLPIKQSQSPGLASQSTQATADPRSTQFAIANQKFQEALAAVREAHRLMPIAIEQSVIYEETKENRKLPACEDALAQAKIDSSRARKAFNAARGKAATTFSAAKRAVQELRRLGPDATGVSPIGSLMFAADLAAIEDCLKMLESKLWDGINSALTERHRAYLWRDTLAYSGKLPATWDAAKAQSLVPESVTIPCTGETIRMHVLPKN